MIRTHFLFSVLLAALPAMSAPAASLCVEEADTLPRAIKLDVVATGLSMPVHLTSATDGSGRLYVVEQDGVIRIIENGKLVKEPFLDISDRVKSGGERGLLSMAFHPDFERNKTFFVNYTASAGGLHTRVSRFQAESGLKAEPRSEIVVMKIDQPYRNHNGGQLAFGPDNMLYIGMGDGGLANDPKRNGQNLSTLLGALLRIDVDKRSADLAYTIPADNPFATRSDARGEIWAYGLRNPWRFSFDRASGALWLADVGQNTREEVNVVRKGGNYGWNIVEGDICTPAVNKQCDKKPFEAPIWAYGHDAGQSITGGFVYRGARIPALCGVYLFGDYLSGSIWGLLHREGVVQQMAKLAEVDDGLSSFGEDDQAELYVLIHRAGKLLRITSVEQG